MRIAYWCADFGIPLPGTAGGSIHIQETMFALRRLGHAVRIFSPACRLEGLNGPWGGIQPLPLEGPVRDAIEAMRDEGALPDHLISEWRALLYAEYAQRVLAPLLTAFQPDVLYERYSLFSYAGMEVARRLGIPHLLEVNAPLVQEQARYRKLVLRHTAEEMEKKVFLGAAALLVVSKALADYAMTLGVEEERVHVHPNGVDPDLFRPDVSGGEARAQHHLEGKRVVGFVGSQRPWHDMECLLRAVGLLAEGGLGVQLLVVGRGPWEESVRQGAAQDVTFAGAVEHRQVPQLMAAMDVVVVPYPAEEDVYYSPLKLFEAMAMGKLVVGARVGQVAEVLAHGQNGLLYEPGNHLDLAEKLREVMQRPDLAAGLGASARRDIVANYTWEQNARRIIGVAESLLRTGTGEGHEIPSGMTSREASL
ncbi:MAG: glycosyltransferase family 4 protein [Chloroflexi bacterium]|nr:glycosyltransferase family 4 protein [Chloroflexota bacterium]